MVEKQSCFLTHPVYCKYIEHSYVVKEDVSDAVYDRTDSSAHYEIIIQLSYNGNTINKTNSHKSCQTQQTSCHAPLHTLCTKKTVANPLSVECNPCAKLQSSPQWSKNPIFC